MLLMILALAGAIPGLAQDDSHKADHIALRALREKVVAAINQQDVKALSGCFAKEFAFTTVTQETLTSEAQAQAFFDKLFRSEHALVTSMRTEPTADSLTRFIDANTGICYGSTKDTYTMKGGRVVDMNLRWSATVVREDGAWKIALAHVGTDFIRNPVTEGLSGLAKKLGIGCGIAGLILGFLLGRILGRKRTV